MGDSHNKSKFTVKLPEQHTKLSTNIKGTIGEYQEIANLTKKGYWVAKACDPQCPFDLVAVSQTGQVTKILPFIYRLAIFIPIGNKEVIEEEIEDEDAW